MASVRVWFCGSLRDYALPLYRSAVIEEYLFSVTVSLDRVVLGFTFVVKVNHRDRAVPVLASVSRCRTRPRGLNG